MGAVAVLGTKAAQAAARWEAIGPEGGRVVVLASDAAGAGTLYAALDEGGVWRSQDSGASWVAARAGLPPGSIRSLAADPQEPGTVYVGRNDGVWKSLDGGRSWTNPAPQIGGKGADVRVLGFDPDSRDLWAGLQPQTGQGSVYRSADGGASWMAVDLGSDGVPVTDIVFGGGDVYVSAAPGGVFRGSPEGGPFARFFATEQVHALAYRAGSVYATMDAGLLVSRDRGSIWTVLLAPPIPNPSRPGAFLVLGEVAISPADPRLIYVAYRARLGVAPEVRGLFRSANGGATFSAVAGGLPAEMPQALLFEPGASGRLLAGPGALGVWSSPDGRGAWSSSHRGLRGAPVLKVVADPKRPQILFIAVEDAGMMKTEDGGASWRLVPLGDKVDFPLAVDPRQPANVYAFAHDDFGTSFLFKGANGGRRWTALNYPQASALQAFALDEARPNRLFAVRRATSDTKIQRSTDGGSTWKDASLFCLLPRGLAVAASGEVYAGGGSRCGRVGELEGGVYRSDDGGATFVNVRSGLPGRPVAETLAADPARPSTLFAGVRGLMLVGPQVLEVFGVYRSRDRAESWQLVQDLGSDGVRTTDFEFAPGSPRSIWFSTLGKGVWRSEDAGETFKPVTAPGLPTERVYDLDFDRGAPAILYAATGGGLFRLAYN